MKQSVKKIINKVSTSLSVINSAGTNANEFAPGATALTLPSPHQAVLAEYYDVLIWMNDNMKQLEGLIDRFI